MKSSEFDLKEIYRLIHNERIPGFVLLRSEREYLEAYREALRKEAEPEKPVRKRKSRKKKETKETEEVKVDDFFYDQGESF